MTRHPETVHHTRASAGIPCRPVVVFDLDGTLITHWPRMYGLYKRYMVRLGKNPALPGQYRALKISGSSERDVAARLLTEPALSTYLAWKYRHIEDPDMLSLDRLLPGTPAVLKRVSETATLWLLTSRQHRRRTLAQLTDLGIRTYFSRIMTVPGKPYAAKKTDAVRAAITALPPGCPVVFVGDTEREIEVARTLGARAVAVSTGVRSRLFLESRKPDVTLSSLSPLPTALRRLLHR